MDLGWSDQIKIKSDQGYHRQGSIQLKYMLTANYSSIGNGSSTPGEILQELNHLLYISTSKYCDHDLSFGWIIDVRDLMILEFILFVGNLVNCAKSFMDAGYYENYGL